MLPLKYIKKAARLQQQLGEIRPGFLHDNTSAIEGPNNAHNAPSPRPSSKGGKHVIVHFELSTSGEKRMIRKK